MEYSSFIVQKSDRLYITRESAHRPLSERVDDIADAGTIRFGKLWLDKEDRSLHWPESDKPVKLSPNEAEIMRMFMGVSHSDMSEGGIISTLEFQRWFDESRKPADKTLTSGKQVYQHIHRLKRKLQLLTGGAIKIESENEEKGRGSRGYFLKSKLTSV